MHPPLVTLVRTSSLGQASSERPAHIRRSEPIVGQEDYAADYRCVAEVAAVTPAFGSDPYDDLQRLAGASCSQPVLQDGFARGGEGRSGPFAARGAESALTFDA